MMRKKCFDENMDLWMIRKMEMRSDEMNDETTYLWMDKRPFKDG